MHTEQQVFVSVGSNTEYEYHFQLALNLLAKSVDALVVSPVYQSSPIGTGGIGHYYNAVVAFVTHKNLHKTQAMLRNIEQQCGRERLHNKVTMDLDLLLFGNNVGCFDHIDLPRKDIVQYAYVLRPLADIAPSLTHPVENKPFVELWQAFCACPDNTDTLEPVDFVWDGRVISVRPSCLGM